MCSLSDSTTISSTSSRSNSNVRRKSKILSFLKLTGKVENKVFRKMSEPNPSSLLLHRKSTPEIKLWSPENFEIDGTKDDLLVETLRKNNMTRLSLPNVKPLPPKRPKKRFLKGKISFSDSPDDEKESPHSSVEQIITAPLKRTRSFRNSWNRLWHKKPSLVNKDASSSSSGSGSEKSNSQNNYRKIKKTDVISVDNNNEVQMKQDNENLLSVESDTINSTLQKQASLSKLYRAYSEANLPGKTDYRNQENLAIDQIKNKGHRRTRSWTCHFNTG